VSKTNNTPIISGDTINGRSVMIAEPAKINGKLESLTDDQKIFMLQVLHRNQELQQQQHQQLTH